MRGIICSDTVRATAASLDDADVLIGHRTIWSITLPRPSLRFSLLGAVLSFSIALAACAHRQAKQPASWEWDASFFQAQSASPNYFFVAAGEKSITGDLDDFVADVLTRKGYSRVPTVDVADFVIYYTAAQEDVGTLLAIVARDNRAFKACMARRPKDGTCTQNSSSRIIYHAESRTAVAAPDFQDGLRGLLGGIPPTGQPI